MQRPENVQIMIRYTCPACSGGGMQRNPDHEPGEQFAPDEFEQCQHCMGNKTVDQWVPLESFLTILTSLDIQSI